MTDSYNLARKLHSLHARTVALQFPEGLKRKAPTLASFLREEGFSVIVSGDPCYGACDLALDTLRHADVLVHFGHTPLGTGDPRVIYEPYSIDFDPAVILNVLPSLESQTIGLVTTAQHVHLVPAMVAELAKAGITARTRQGSRGCGEGQVLGCAFGAARIPEVTEILFVGTGIFHALGVHLATGKRVIALDPLTGSVVAVNAERFLRQRHALIEKARSAEIYGLIVSSKSGQERYKAAKDMAERYRNAIVIMVREVCPDELLNLGFPAYVNFACPRLAYDDQSRFPAPLLTPQEFQILLGEREFSGYTIDEME
ncbi:MAG: diphthamide biosynthesis enzyme Dph2 [Methanolinea sp.]|nr:diphthamide biosynthesis enzyme Dph2 [Methanolinea sp.]